MVTEFIEKAIHCVFFYLVVVTVGILSLEECQLRFAHRLAEAGQEGGGSLGEEGFGHAPLLGVREVGVAALLRREVGRVQPDKKAMKQWI